MVCCGSLLAPNLVPVSEAGMKLDLKQDQSQPSQKEPPVITERVLKLMGREDDLLRPDTFNAEASNLRQSVRNEGGGVSTRF